MVSREKLYEAFGELIYAVAKADGKVQDEEIKVLKEVLKSHPWASYIEWSFNYEKSRDHSVEYTYKKAIDIFKQHGPDGEYPKFIEVFKMVADAFGGITDDEQKVIDNFQQDLVSQFKQDLEIIGNEKVL
jgi:tellurite resistance protein